MVNDLILIKTKKEVELLRVSNSIVGKVLKELSDVVKINNNISTQYLNSLAEKMILGFGAEPGFKKFSNFPYTITTSIDNEVIQGFPNGSPLIDGSVLSIDVGVFKDGYYGDGAITIPVGKISNEQEKTINTCKQALMLGIDRALPGNSIKDISKIIETYVNGCGLTTAKQLTGHGIGRRLHEVPSIPNRAVEATTECLKANMVISIEPIVFGLGDEEVKTSSWGWKTKLGSIAAHFEHTILITNEGNEILSI